MFSDSCNFLHDVKIKVKNPEITIISSPTPESTPALSRADSVTSSPASESTVLKARSPPRSPRLSSLLLALGDAIGPEDEQGDGQQAEEENAVRVAELVPQNAMFGQVRRQSDAGTGDEEAVDPSEAGKAMDENKTENSTADETLSTQAQSAPSASQEPSQEHLGSDLMSPVELIMAPPFWNPIGQLPQTFHR